MMVPYIDYKEMKEFYTIQEVCELFGMPKEMLRKQCELYQVTPRRNEIGEYGFVTYDVRKLHNAIYKANKEGEDDPWA